MAQAPLPALLVRSNALAEENDMGSKVVIDVADGGAHGRDNGHRGPSRREFL
jgi:hypothetical protein